jgi:TPR repeat protein
MPLDKARDAARKRSARKDGTVDKGKEAARRQKIYYEKKAKEGNTNAQFKLGCIYWEGSDAVKKDILMAAAWFRKAADQGHEGAQLNLNEMIANGLEVTPVGASIAMNDQGASEKKARKMDANAEPAGKKARLADSIERYWEAAEQGDAEAQFNLGTKFESGQGTRRPSKGARMHNSTWV